MFEIFCGSSVVLLYSGVEVVISLVWWVLVFALAENEVELRWVLSKIGVWGSLSSRIQDLETWLYIKFLGAVFAVWWQLVFVASIFKNPFVVEKSVCVLVE